MDRLTIDELARISATQPIVDILVGIELLDEAPPGLWGRQEGGPVLLCFGEGIRVVLRQPIGRAHIEAFQILSGEPYLPEDPLGSEFPTAFMRLYETACYRKDLNDVPPFVQTLTTFSQEASSQQETPGVAGMIWELSTGGSIGVDASSYGGLVLFFDGHTALFRRECVAAYCVKETVVWTRATDVELAANDASGSEADVVG